MARIEFAWELGAGTGHVTTLLPIAIAMKARGHEVRFFLRDLSAGADLEGAAEIPREGAPIWSGPPTCEAPLNLGEILLNFGYHDGPQHKALVDAWRERLKGSHVVVANVSPAAHLAALTLGIPSFEISQGFHVPPPAMPSPPLRHWEPAPRARLEAADRRVLHAINTVLSGYGVQPLATIGELFAGDRCCSPIPSSMSIRSAGPATTTASPTPAKARRYRAGRRATARACSPTSIRISRDSIPCSRRSRRRIARRSFFAAGSTRS